MIKAFRSKLSALKKRLLNQEALSVDESLWADQTLWAGEPPSFVDMAELLVKALPTSDRSEAYTLLVTQLLPKKVAQLPTFLDPLDQRQGIYSEIAEYLQKSRPTQRLQLLRADLCQTEIILLSLDSLMLAMARYMQQHPDAIPKANCIG